MKASGRPITIVAGVKLVTRGWDLYERMGRVFLASPRGRKYQIREHGRRYWAIPIPQS